MAATTTTAGSTSSTTPPLSGAFSNHSHSQQQSARMESTTVCLPICYGSIAFGLPVKKSASATAPMGDSTHEWTLYLRGPNNEDLSCCMEKVVFTLHPSFAQPVRELTMAPYQVTERGWGEFEAQIRIHWKDSKEQATVLSHLIKLYPPPPPPGTPAADTSDDPVVAESYEEIVFTNPTESFFDALRQVPEAPPLETQDHIQHLPQYSDADDFMAILEAKKFLKNELDSAKERLVLVNQELEQMDVNLREAQEKVKTQAVSSPRKVAAAKAATARPPVAKKTKTGA